MEINIDNDVDEKMLLTINLEKSSIEENLINLATDVNYKIVDKQVKLFNSK